MYTYTVISRPAGLSYLDIAAQLVSISSVRVSSPQRAGSEAHRAADIHGVSKDIEREPLDTVIHENAKVVAEERACNAEDPC
jgi:hypothetical protein